VPGLHRICTKELRCLQGGGIRPAPQAAMLRAILWRTPVSETIDAAPPAPATPPRPSLLAALGMPGVKLAMVGALALVLLLPSCMVGELIEEREGRQHEVAQEIGAAWGQPQNLEGPMLVVPLRTRRNAAETNAPTALVLHPQQLNADARLAPEQRRRGLFSAVVYTATLAIEARFDLGAPLPADVEPRWSEAYLLLTSEDLRLAEPPLLRWAGRELGTAPGGGDARCGGTDALRWPLDLTGPPQPGAPLTLSGTLSLRGSRSFALTPLGPQTRLTIAAPWVSPSFSGASLPHRATQGPEGFSAEWRIAAATRAGYVPIRSCEAELMRAPRGSGVTLVEAVSTYRMVSRAAKYAAMFIALAFLTYLLFELVAGVRIHVVQYGMLGGSMVLFPLLLLAIAEPLGFVAAYGIATALVMGQASLYTAAVTGQRVLAGVFAALLAALFGFLYVVLSLESLALLAGAIALFAALSAAMLATRRFG